MVAHGTAQQAAGGFNGGRYGRVMRRPEEHLPVQAEALTLFAGSLILLAPES